MDDRLREAIGRLREALKQGKACEAADVSALLELVGGTLVLAIREIERGRVPVEDNGPDYGYVDDSHIRRWNRWTQ